MVLWGQSAGGNAANSYGYAYPEDPIVAGIVAQSGTVSQLNSPNTTAFTILAKQLGCDGLDAEEELACMQQAPNDRLHSVIRSGAGVPRFSPAVDDVTLFANNTARFESGLVAKVVGDEQLDAMGSQRRNVEKLTMEKHDSLSSSATPSTKAPLSHPSSSTTPNRPPKRPPSLSCSA
jgi:carboxylesterase type B